MTIKEAKDVLQKQIDKYGDEYDDEGIEALDIAIKALEQEPETVTEFADRCRECGAKYEELLKQYKAFTEWVAREMFSDDWNFNKDSFAELACRKLANLGIVRAKGDEWELVELQTESEEEE